MRNIIISVVLFSLGFSPITPVLASPGALDQYGGHTCTSVDCEDWGLSYGAYHYHTIPTSYDYLSGFTLRSSTDMVFYMPEVAKKRSIVRPATFSESPLNSDTAFDGSLCNGDGVFGGGRYDAAGNVRVRPVCERAERDDETNTKLYKSVVQKTGEPITKVYHIENHDDGKTVYTDAPDIRELRSSLVQGESDSALFMVDYRTDALKQISTGEAFGMFGSDWRSHILYFDDAIVYSYPIAR